MFLAATLFLVSLLILILLTRLKSQMAALVAWIVGTITGSREDDKGQEQTESPVRDTDISKGKKTKQKPKKSPPREPSFSTALTTPIEEVIEETLNEEVKSALESKPVNKPKKRSKQKTKSRSPESVQGPVELPSVKEKSEDVGSLPSFVPVRDKKRKNQRSKTDDLLKSSPSCPIEQYQSKRSRSAPVEEFVVVERVEPKNKPKENVIEIVNKETGRAVYLEAKESKKVHAKISYASVASQRFEESLERLRKEEERLKESEAKGEERQEFEGVSGAECETKPEVVNAFDEKLEVVHAYAKTEVDLISEIQSEERRLVDLIEEDQKEAEEILEVGDHRIGKEATRSQIETPLAFLTDDQRKQEVTPTQISNVCVGEDILKENREDVVGIDNNGLGVENLERRSIIDEVAEVLTDTTSEIEVIDSEEFEHDKTSINIPLKVEESAHSDIKSLREEQPIDDIKIVTDRIVEDVLNQNYQDLDTKQIESVAEIIREEVAVVERYGELKTQNYEKFTEARNSRSRYIKETEQFLTFERYSEIQTHNYQEFVSKDRDTNEQKEYLKSEIDYQKLEETYVETENTGEVKSEDQTTHGGKDIEGPDSKIDTIIKETEEFGFKDQNGNSEDIHFGEEVVAEDHENFQNEARDNNTSSDFLRSETVNRQVTEEVSCKNIEEQPLSYITAAPSEYKPFKMSSGTQTRVLTLNDKEHQDSTLYRLQKNWILQFRLGPSLLGRKVLLYCNYPKENGEFKRNTYNLLEWRQEEGCTYSDDTALLTELTPTISGSFHYYFTYADSGSEEHQGSGFFLVDPVLTYGNKEELPLDCIQCQTVLTKGLGPFDTWESKLRVAKESGYNVIHFTPIQELGASNSSYSLSEQLKVNPIFTKQSGDETTFEDVDHLIKKMRTDWKVASICDIVLNHTANESEWLKQHPEGTYNCHTCPYMRPAYLLDAALHQFSLDVSKGLYEDKGIPTVTTEDHLNSVRYYLQSDVLVKVKIHELSTCDVTKYVSEFLNLIRKQVPPSQQNPNTDEEITLIQDPLYRRLSSSIDMNLAVKLYNVYRYDCYDEETRIKKCAEDFKNKLEALNKEVMDETNEHLKVAVENVIDGIRYFRVQHDGPKIKEITIKNPLVSRYFTDHGKPQTVKEHEDVMYSDNGKFLMAHNGWVMNSDPLRNFAAPGSNVYIRRELIAWGDSVKLRYGDKPEDCPFLWAHMRAYVEQTARIFDGVRLDNCHSTPIPVAEYLLDCARKVKPDLYVVAELFTNSDLTDNIFVNRLGITSLIREAMSAWDSHEQGRLVYRYGGSPVGSFYQPRIRPLVPSIAHALFLDLTHDNPSPVEKRSVFDLLPSTALVNMACCGSGSNRGYDELVPHHIHVVDETRQYTEWTDDENLAWGNSRYVTRKSGIIAAKKALNDLHLHLGVEGFDQVYVDQMDADIVAVTRHCPDTHQSYVLVAFTAFAHPPEDTAFHQRGIKPLRVEGVLDEIVLEATLDRIDSKTSSKYANNQDFRKDNRWINGLSEYQVHLKQNIQPENSEIFEKVDTGTPNLIQLNFKNFKPGTIAVIKVSLPRDMSEAVKNIRKLISQFSLKKETELWKVISEMTLPDLNRALYRCDQEERDEGHGFGTYNIPNFGPLVYAGFQGFMSLLGTIRPNNDLGHPMCANLRDGNWMIDYICQRLKFDEGTKRLSQWLEENTKSFHSIPRYLIPCYFDVIVTGIYVLLLEQSYNLMADFVKHGSAFVKGLSLGSLQCSAYIKSADLPVLSPNLSDPKPPQRKNDKGERVQACVSLSAGLPHFSVGYMRNWGRDTFIALRGLFLLTGRYQDARYHILGYAACLRHGLIPNLLDGGRNSRFNCRDAIWWWLHCIKYYTEEVPNGVAILTDKVSRIFPTDDSPAQPSGTVDQRLLEVIQEALTVHFQGLVFRERNAGRQIDEHMSDQGFNNQIGIHPETGFVFGGNSFNCGTWMDKMGSSDKAGNRGKPATPRDGSAIELIGLSKAAITWLEKLHKDGVYPYGCVERTGKNGVVTKWTFKEWADKIQTNFEKYFWVNSTPLEGEIRPDLINKRGIYKDCFGASQEWTDFQLRCNFPVAMVVAPELFDPKHAWVALKQAEKYLLGPLGMKTLDPEDWAYNANYDNSNDSDNFNVSHGFNYHQGPEWVWPVGFYLRARLHFAKANGELAATVNNTKVVLSKHFVELQTSTWRGLPELTNKDGAYCNDSSRTQAWSMSCILEVLRDLQEIEKGQPLIN